MLRNIDIWLLPYLRHRFESARSIGLSKRLHILFCFVDHFEPLQGNADEDIGSRRISRWIESYEALARHFNDSCGHTPRHSYFYPLEEYREHYFETLKKHCEKGYGEVEIHLHHHNDTAINLERSIEKYKTIYRKHGFLGSDAHNNVRFGFVHGNWALDNSSPDGMWCGVNSEISVLNRIGCYADFTLPSAPSPTQTRTINSIYYAVDDPDKPKSHNTGVRVKVGGAPPRGVPYLMIIQGPLMLDWRWRWHGILPRIENSDISAGHPPMKHRWKLWIDASVTVAGRPEWIFIKVHTHGCSDENYDLMFERGAFEKLQNDFLSLQREEVVSSCHYVSAREMYNIIKAAEAGVKGNPYDYKDFIVTPPECLR